MEKNREIYLRFWSLRWGHIMNRHQSNALDTASILVSNLWFSLTLRDYAQSGSQCLNITLPDQVKHPPEQAFWNIHCCSVLLWCFMAAFGCCGGLDSESSTAFWSTSALRLTDKWGRTSRSSCILGRTHTASRPHIWDHYRQEPRR